MKFLPDKSDVEKVSHFCRVLSGGVAMLGLTGLIGMFVFSELSEIKETEFLLLTLPTILFSYVFAKVAVTGYPPRLLMFTLGDKRK